MSTRSFDGIWISANLWFTKELSLTEKILLLEIKSLDNDFGCTKTNKGLGDTLDIKPNTVSLMIKSIESKGFISVSYKDYNTFEGRVININYDKCSTFFTPPEKSKGVPEKSKALPKKSIHSNTISNTISNNNSNITSVAEATAYKLVVDFWLKEFHPNWTFNGVQGKAIKSLISKIKKVLRDGGRPDSDDEVLNTFKYICQSLPDFYKQKDVQVIDSKFNEIITEIKTSRNGKPTAKKQSIYQSQR